MSDTSVLHGLRRDLTREMFEDLAALQCTPEEILGYVGTDLKRLESWCRRIYGRNRSLGEMLGMIRQDGLIAIRRASFEQLRKSATLVAQQYTRFLPDAGREKPSDEAVQSFASLLTPVSSQQVEELFE